jgi:hypothetical protein
MGFTGGPLTFIAPGVTHQWNYTWGDDRGAQVATAHVIDPAVILWATAQGEERETRGYVVYWVRIVNEGPYGVTYNLQGGGLT